MLFDCLFNTPCATLFKSLILLNFRNTDSLKIFSKYYSLVKSCTSRYLILRLIEIPQEFGKSLLDKLRYLQSYMCQEISYVHWFKKLIWLR